jgi:hypothetical protein
MAKQDLPTYVLPDLHRPGLDLRPMPEANLQLVAGWWIASCPTCGFQLAEGHRQDKVERKACRVLCPVCHVDAA